MNTEINKIYNEPCLETLKRMPSDYLDCIITSPPYWQLRDYGYPEQWGLESTYQEYLEHLWQMMDEIYRVLKPIGTCWINLGDTYARGKRSKDSTNDTLRNTKKTIEPNSKPNYGDLNKCLLLIPHRFAIGCIDRGWIVRNDIVWAKRNGMPESITDRFTKKHEYFFFMVKSEKYYFNLDAIRDKVKDNNKGKNPSDVSDFWDIPTKPTSNEHYASYNQELIRKPILSGCPEGGIIYDPFMGTGSTAEASLRANRNFIGSEMSIKYCKIAEDRLKPFLMQNKLF